MWVRVIVATVLLLLPTGLCAQSEKRVALVIGNSAYQNTPGLPNPVNDASDMSAALKKRGFKTIEGFDLDKQAFDRKVRDFSNILADAEVSLFFYAGHGLQVAGQNYLVPIDAKAETADALDWEMVRLDLVQRTMERVSSTSIIFLDACRNNPLARNLARAMGTRSAEINRGLAAVESGVGTLISFSTQPGNVAVDGSGRNSPFAGALVKNISSNSDLSTILISVRNDVIRETQGKQVPWEHSALRAKFYFSPSAQVSLSRAELYESLMRRILARKLVGTIDPRDEGKDNYYRSSAKQPKALAACIDWATSTPIRLEYLGFAFAANLYPTQSDADERALSSCYRLTNGCLCTLVDRNDNDVIVFPAEWMEQHKSALRNW
jgi:uncharacterized caspase-like protein